jgi:ribulose bisphosphate carboxylase small subunit
MGDWQGPYFPGKGRSANRPTFSAALHAAPLLEDVQYLIAESFEPRGERSKASQRRTDSWTKPARLIS